MAEYLKSKLTGGCYQRNGSFCITTRRKSHHEAEHLMAESGSGLSGAAAPKAAASGVERLLPEDFDTARPRPNVVLIMCDDQGK